MLLPAPFFEVKTSKEDASAPADGSLGGNSGALSGNVIRKEVGEPEVNQLDVDFSIIAVTTSDASPDAFNEIISSATGAGAALIMFGHWGWSNALYCSRKREYDGAFDPD